MKVAGSKTREQFPLSTKKVLKKTIVGVLVWSILLLIIFGIFAFVSFSISGTGSFFGLISVISLSIVFLIVLVTYFYQLWYYAVYFYDLNEDYIVIKKGPITPHEITIPYERIQDVYVDQDLLDRIFGLYDVHLSSATISSGMAAHIDGLEKPAADGLRKALLDTVSKKIGRPKVQASAGINNVKPV